ncbi:MAG: Endonuclease/exonuclease/phosphatase [Actinotalea sp.]|nr:Endonuclease/exonuclease/phosphatase [Actinotalea sp.]
MRLGRATVGVAALTVVAAAGVALVTFPGIVGLHGTAPVAQALALRSATGGGLLACALLLLVLPWRRRLLVPALVLLLGTAVQVAVLADRGLGGLTGEAPPSDVPADGLVVLVLNTHDAVSPRALADLVLARGADVVVLPETRAATGEETVALLAEDGRDLQVLADDGAGGGAPTALLVDRRLGEYLVVEEHPGHFSTFTAAPVAGDGPPVTAVHTFPPVEPFMADWLSETRAAVALCGARTGAVVAGDLNSTLDHPAFDALGSRGALAGCRDAAVEAGSGGVGTWPTATPRLLGAPIDHVLVDGTAWRVVRADVLDPPPGTDHRALLAVLVPAGEVDG